MMFGGTNGFTIFDPAKIQSNNFVPPVAIVGFQIFNKPVIVGAQGSPLTKSISQTDSITLNYHQTVFSFSFVAMSYRNTAKNKFAYMMEGLEKDWNYVGHDRRNATYTNLNPGTYTFKVKASNNEGVWNEVGRSIKIRVLPPPWKTWWAYTLYALLVIGLLKWFVSSQRRLVVLLEGKVNERTSELRSKHFELEQAYAQLEAISLADPLTGLNNRRYLQKMIPTDIVKVQREYANNTAKQERKSSLDFIFLLLDIDFFKQVNDTYGHTAGDQLLIQISKLLTRICRESDCLVRWGGEEFLIVNRFVCRDEALLMAERIRESVAQHKFILADGTVLQKTCSIGFACYPFVKDMPAALSWEQVIDIADRALYAAKRSGRNRSVGLAASDAGPAYHLYEKLGLNLKAMIDNQGITVISSSNETLKWD
jgi:diguanylate cyclase (GGDEF)-like protein